MVVNDIKKGDKLICLYDIGNFFGQSLFKENQIYTVLDVDNDLIYLDHILYANEYTSFDSEWVIENFKKIN
jgi:hypothetical protein